MKKIRIFLAMVLMTVSAAAFAAGNIPVKGTVTDAASGEPVVGASVVLQGSTSVYTETGLDGTYEISVPEDGTLVVNCLGYLPRQIAVNGKSILNIAITVDSQSIDETIVVAYGTASKSTFTGSASMVKSETIAAHAATNVTSALQGTTAGVTVISSSGDPTSNEPTIYIRGYGSMNASSTPLIILDGMPYDGNIRDINSADVESMSVLKDAASSAIYGHRGANGVVLITTKKGKSGDAEVRFDAKWGSNSRLIPQYDVMTNPGEYYETIYKSLYGQYFYSGHSEAESHAYAQANLLDGKKGGAGYLVYTVPEGENLVGTNFKLNPNAVLGYSDGEYYYTPDDWYNETFHNSFRQEYVASISGSGDKFHYYGSLGYLDDGGIVANSGYKRYSARINADYQAKKWLKFISNIGYTHSDSQSPSYSTSDWASSGNVFYITNSMGPIYPLYVRDAQGKIMESNGLPVFDANQTNQKRPNTVGNAVRDNLVNTKKSVHDVVNGNWGLNITPVKGLSIQANVGVHVDNNRYNALSSQFGSASSVDGAASVYASKYFTLNQQYLAKYTTSFGGTKHNLDVYAGYERYKLTYSYLSAYNDHLFDPYVGELGNATGKAQMTSNSYVNTYMTKGIFANAQYDYDGKYVITGSYRRGASSVFAPGHQWGDFGAVSAAWVISKENFMANASWVDFLKIKAGYGIIGNDTINDANDAYAPYSDQYKASYDEDAKAYSLTLTYKGNEQLTWETINSANVGVEFELLGGYLNGSIEYYNRVTKDLLYNKEVPLSAGNPTGYYPTNVGSMRNAGIDIDLGGKIISNDNVNWTWNLNMSHNKNTILALDPDIERNGGIKTSYYIRKVGGSKYEAYLLKAAGLSDKGQQLYWMKVKDEDGNPTGELTTTADPTKADQFECGTVDPKLTGGFGTSLEFFGVDISCQLSFALGGKYYDGTYQSLMHTDATGAGSAWHKDALKAWTPENTNTDIPRLDNSTLLGQTAVDKFLISGNFLSVNNVTVGYTFPKKICSAIKMSSLRIYFTGENLAVLTARKGIDPRYSVGVGSYTNGSGRNNNAYSSMRTITGGITLTF